MNDDEGRPTYAYWRRVHVAGTEHPLVEFTTDYRTWDRWVDELDASSDAKQMPGTTKVELYGSALSWSHDLTPQLKRVIQRVRSR